MTAMGPMVLCSERLQDLGNSEVLTAPRAPLQNALAERVIGSIWRECLGHVIVLNERHRSTSCAG